MTSDLLEGRSIVVTGSSRGIGREVAALLARQGAGVVVNGRDAAAAHAAAEEIVAAGGQAAAVSGSAADDDVADALIETATAQFGGLDAVVTCAGVAEPAGSSILTVADEQWQTLLDAHLNGVFRVCRRAAPVFAAQRRGVIVNTGSSAFLGDYGGTGYPAGKGAVNSLTMALAAELAEYGVRANVVCPGARTRLSTGAEYLQHIDELHRRGLLDEFTYQASLDPAPPDYVAPLYAYLCSDRAAAITGQIFIASGGFVGRYPRPEPAVLAFRDHADTPPFSYDELDAVLAPAFGAAPSIAASAPRSTDS